jgi:HSP90 family molecular chaperone
MSNQQKTSFKIDTRIAEILGESYRSSEQALKELIDNAWDADATKIEITLPQPMTEDAIIITDNGSGMTAPEVNSEYLHIGRNRKTLRGERTKKLNRLVKGQKGIGKFAGLMVADQMVLSTSARGIRSSFQIRKSELLISNRNLEDYEIIVQTSNNYDTEAGTRIELRDLNQNLSFPNSEKMRALLIREYGRESDIEIIINGQTMGIEDLPGASFEEVISLESGGSAKIKFTVADGKRNVKDAGIAIRIGGKVIGRPQMLGLNESDLIPKNLLGKVYGEVELEGVDLDCVTADNGGFSSRITLPFKR